MDSLDSRLSAQVDKRVDQRVDETLKDRLSVIERAIADLDRTVHELEGRLAGKGKDKDPKDPNGSERLATCDERGRAESPSGSSARTARRPPR